MKRCPQSTKRAGVSVYLDSHTGAPGASDNGTAVVSLLSAAEGLARGPRPERSVRFALPGAEEHGDFGGGRAHLESSGEGVVAVLGLDHGAGLIQGVYAMGNPDDAPILREVSTRLEVGGEVATLQMSNQSDHEVFDEAGIPSFPFVQDPGSYIPWTHHSQLDEPDHVHPEVVARNAVAVEGWARELARSGFDIPPRRYQSPVEDPGVGAPVAHTLSSEPHPESEESMLCCLIAALALQAPTDTVRLEVDLRDTPPRPLFEEQRIGSLDGEADAFGFVSGATVGPEGRLLVADDQGPAIRVFDPDGVYVGDLGGGGQGPGEFTMVNGLAVDPDGRHVVFDFNNQRLSWFDREGAFERSARTQLTSMVGGAVGFPGLVPLDDGNLLLRTGGGRKRPDGVNELFYLWLRVDPEGNPLDTLAAPPREVAGHLPRFKEETVSVPLRAGGFATGRTDEYQLEWPLTQGRLVQVDVRVPEARVQQGERRAWEERGDLFQDAMSVAPGPVPDVKPPWRSLFEDADRRIWVERSVEAEERPGYGDRSPRMTGIDWVEDAVFDVFHPSGRFLGTVELPPFTALLHAEGGRVWTLQRGVFQEQYVVRYAVDFLPAGPVGARW